MATMEVMASIVVHLRRGDSVQNWKVEKDIADCDCQQWKRRQWGKIGREVGKGVANCDCQE